MKEDLHLAYILGYHDIIIIVEKNHSFFSGYYVAKVFWGQHIIFAPFFYFYFIYFSSLITYHSPDLGCMKMPLGMGGPLGK